jgi:glycosyltransferase involved in cell wall biosynthesis
MNKICFLSHTSELNGAELMLLQTLERIDKQKFYPFLIVPRPGLLLAEAEKLGIETVLFPAKWWLTGKGKTWTQPLAWAWNIRALFRLVRWIRRKQVDLVFSNSSASLTGALAAKITHVPHVWFIHEILGGKAPQICWIWGQKALAWFISRFSCRILVNSHASEAFFFDKENVQLVYNGVEISERKEDAIKTLRQKWDVDEQDIVLGMVGKVCEEKGQREVILALGGIGKDRGSLKLLIVGDVKSKAYFKELQEICVRYGLEDCVVFTGYQRDVASVLCLMDCLLVASRAESFGRTIIEAMSVKIPVIAAKSGGIPEIVIHGKNGFLLESGEIGEIENAIVSFLDNRDSYRKVAEAGYRTVVEKFSLIDQVKKIERVMEECIGQRGESA